MIFKPNTFNDIQDNNLRAYNRAIMTCNLLEENGEQHARKYLNQFGEKDRAAIGALLMAIKTDPEETKRRVLQNVKTQD